MSFQITLSPTERAAGWFVATVRRKLQKALADRRDLNQSDLAREIGVNRSVITRQLRGSADMSLARVAEIATVLGYEPDFVLRPIVGERGQNSIAQVPGSLTVTKDARTATATAQIVSPQAKAAA